VANQRAAFWRPSDVPGALTAGLALLERVAVPPKGDSNVRRHKQRKQTPTRITAGTTIDAMMIDSNAAARESASS
jgi:hypothetical protein